MEKELEEKLYAKYPKIFADRNKSMHETCMYWGLECGLGWYGLLDKLCEEIQNYLDLHPDVPQVIARQVKEKFGYLNFYIQGGNDDIDKMIENAENESMTICEDCGSTDHVARAQGYWITYLCLTCRNKKQNEPNNNYYLKEA